ncbi:MAG: GNAT family N-acetyltransferase [Acidimicrobiales bacterium]|nr:GNAT family N-acetyltransferase [Acidimicrobiales bacterium]
MTGRADQWEADVVLADGGTARLRPAVPDDQPGVQRLAARLQAAPEGLQLLADGSGFPSPRDEGRLMLVALVDDRVVAAARFDRVDGGDATIAFVVDDDEQGRGIGTTLLEHLAAVARERGIHRFVADVAPGNQQMLRVFLDAGFEVDQTYSGSTVRVAFSIEPTPSSLAAMAAREQVAEAHSMRRLLAPRSIAVVGAGRRSGTIGHEVFRNLLAGGFDGPVYPVHPTAKAVASVRAWPSVLSIPGHVDLAVVTVPAVAVPGVVEECAQKGVHGLVVISAGFAEEGGDRAEAERQLVDLARRHGMRLVGPNCMGVVNTNADVRMNATFAPFAPLPGRVAFLSQSGALGIELLGRAGALNLGVSTFVSVGNKADVSGNDLLLYWEEDEDTDVILLYLESFGNPRKFARIAREVSRRKPIVAVKSGRSAAGSRAASSHTAALASPDVAVDALFRQAGVIRVDTLEELFDAARILTHQPLPPGRRVAVVGNAGGPGILAADALDGAGLSVPVLSDATQEALRSFLPSGAAVRNPVDLIASATAEQFERAARVVLADPGVDALLVIFIPPLVTRAEDVARAVARASGDAGDKPVLACFLGHRRPPEELAEAPRRIPSFAYPEPAAKALGRVADYAEWRRRPAGEVPELPGIDLAGAADLVAAELERSGGESVWLDPDRAAGLCACFGIPVAPVVRVASADEAAAAAARLGGRVALKAASGALVHKTDVGAVRLDLDGPGPVRQAYEEMEEALGPAMGGAVVQQMAPPGMETIVGVTHDPAFGPLVLFGMGGVAAELVRDRALSILPLTDAAAHDLVRSLRSSPLLFGYRNLPVADTAALEDLLVRVGILADELPEVVELDCNPVLVGPSGAVAVDVKVRLAPVSGTGTPDVRRG